MLRRGLAFSLLLAVASAAQAGVIVDLVPATAGPYAQDQSVDVDIMLRQDPTDGDHSLRFIQFDFNTTAPELTLIPPRTHDLTPTDIRFWNFVGVTNCVNSTDAACGSGHFLEDVLNGPRGRILSATYFFTDPADLGENATAQRILFGNGDAVKVGVMRVKMPLQDGVFMLDVVNAAETNPDVGGVDVRWGFGLNVNAEPLTTWRANTGEITGGTMEMCVGAKCPNGECTVNLASSVPPFTSVGQGLPPAGGTLWRTAANIVRMTFSGNPPGVPGVGEIEVVELLPDGAFGADLIASGVFSIALDAPGNILKIQDHKITPEMANKKWYAVRNTGGWSDVCPFEIHFPVVAGDQDGNRFVTPIDVGNINAGAIGLLADDSRFDIDGNGFGTPTDVGLANANQGPGAPKPTGH